MGIVTYIKGATAWEFQVWRIWFAVRFPRFWRTSGLGFVRFTSADGSWPRLPHLKAPRQ
jgi:hypothetical protein